MAEKKITAKTSTSKKVNKKEDGVLICNTAHLAEMFGVSERQIYNQIQNGVAVKIGANKFDCVKSVKNYIDKIREAEELRKQTPEQLKGETEAVKLEHERLKARKTELQVLQMEGTLHYEEDVKALWNSSVFAAKSKLTSIGAKLAAQLKGETDEGTIKEHIDREVYEALKEISEYNAEAFNGISEGEDDEDESEGVEDDEDGDSDGDDI